MSDAPETQETEQRIREEEWRIARLITASIRGTRWRDLTPLGIAQYLVANGVRIIDAEVVEP